MNTFQFGKLGLENLAVINSDFGVGCFIENEPWLRRENQDFKVRRTDNAKVGFEGFQGRRKF
jgi:hypothetical protein